VLRFSSSSSSSTGVAVDAGFVNYLQYGGSGATPGSFYNDGGTVASTTIGTQYSQCLAAATSVVVSVTMGDDGSQALDLNAYKFSTQQLSYTRIAQLCSELCCATTGCINAAFSTIPVQYPNYGYYGCSNTNLSIPMNGVTYDTCCVLRGSNADAYSNPTDHKFSSIFYTTKTYTCPQGSGATNPSVVFAGAPSSMVPLTATGGTGIVPAQSVINQCLNYCRSSGPYCGTSIVNSNALGSAVVLGGVTYPALNASYPYACFVFTSSSPLTQQSISPNTWFSIPVLPNSAGQTSC
jgi:hypothetical protein